MEILAHQRLFLITGVSLALVLVSLPRENPTAGAAVEFGCAGNAWSVPSAGRGGSDWEIQNPPHGREKSSLPRAKP